jgi:hypothetical protein
LSAFVNRLCRRAAALVLAVAVGMQAFLAGLAAEGASVHASGASDFAVICHGSGAADEGNGTAPEPATAKHPCCVFCTAAAPALAAPPNSLRLQPARSFEAAIPNPKAILIAWRAVRAGLSQAPPRLDLT